MSYRSFKRVLGETSLERKCRFLFGACLLLLITGSFWWYGALTEDEIHRTNFNNCHPLAESALMNVHIKLVFNNDDQNKGSSLTASGVNGTKSLSEEMTKEFQSQDYIAEYILPNARTPEKMPKDDFERSLFERWNKVVPLDKSNEQENGDANQDDSNDNISKSSDGLITRNIEAESRIVPNSEGKMVYQYYETVRARYNNCVDCHRPFVSGEGGLSVNDGLPTSRLELNDLLGIVRITKPYGPTQKALNRNRAILLTTAIITVFLAMVALYVIVRYVIVKPLAHLRDVSNEITKGNIDQRANIHTGDEFEELASAFNRMMQHLVSAHTKLSDVNEDLDRKFDQLAQANMRLHEMNRMKNDFLATMSHELRTPLNSIIGFSDVLQTIEGLNEKQRNYVGNIQRSGRLLLEMINDILDLAKIESGRMDVRLSDFRIDAIVSAPCDMARPLAEKKNIDLDVQIEGDIPELHQDSGKIQQILNNLLSNAIKFTPEGGQIRVHASRDRANKVKITVVDTGVGIAQEDQIHIFEKFRQGTTVLAGGDAMTREYSGTGLGLSIVKELCKLLGGEITLQSDLGRGSTFTIYLPVHLKRQPRLDSPLNESVDELTKPRRIDYQRAIDAPLISNEESSDPTATSSIDANPV